MFHLLLARADSYANFKYFYYDPSKIAALVFIVLFVLTSLIHLSQLIRIRSWYLIPMTLGGLCEAIGYVGRYIASTQTPNWTLGPYIMQSITILVAPALFAASIYMILGRIILATDGEHLALIRKKWLTKIFVTCDVLSFFVLSAGGGMLASGGKASLGENIILAGLFIQIVAFGLFIIVAVLFHSRLSKNPTNASVTKPWQRHLFVLYFASLLIMIRSVVRVVEYIQGQTGYILTHEIFLYIFDAALMWLALAVFNVVHPGQLLNKNKSAFQMEEELGTVHSQAPIKG